MSGKEKTNRVCVDVDGQTFKDLKLVPELRERNRLAEVQPSYVEKLKRIVHSKPESPKHQQASTAMTSHSVTPRVITKVNMFNLPADSRESPNLTPKPGSPRVTSPKGAKVINYFRSKNQSVGLNK